ncbi:hypothetical protein KEM54_006692 [Ascosphaera aggregata]|nr:hypothetical protein KEM54_006692 [Ascosphaera aggregata]
MADVRASSSLAELGEAVNSTTTTTTPAPMKLTGRQLYEKMGSPKYILAPMVDRSEFAWRMLTRSFMDSGVSNPLLAYTPMFHARLFNEAESYRKQHFEPLQLRDPSSRSTTPPAFPDELDLAHYESYLDGNPAMDRPLIVQFCANDPDELLKAARKVEKYCDAVDLNLGCPQGIAKKGHYGSFLQEEPDLIYKLISKLHHELSIPVTAKFRIQETKEKTLEYAKMILSAGASIIGVHGRRREQKGHNTGVADWSYIRYLRDNLPPETVIFANGNILCHEDLDRCLKITGADGVMSAEGVLSDPSIFAKPPSVVNTCAYWKGRDGQQGYRMDYVLRRYMDLLYRHVLKQRPPSRQPLFDPTEENLKMAIIELEAEAAAQSIVNGESDYTDGPPKKRQKKAKTRKEAREDKNKHPRVTSPNLTPIQGHLFQLLRPLVSKHTDIRDALAQAKPGCMAEFENIVLMVDDAVKQGLIQYARDPASVEAEYSSEYTTGDIDYDDSKARALSCKKPWFVCQPYVRPLPEEALAIGAMKLSKKEIKAREAERQEGESVQKVDQGGQTAAEEEQKENEDLEREKKGLGTPNVITKGPGLTLTKFASVASPCTRLQLPGVRSRRDPSVHPYNALDLNTDLPFFESPSLDAFRNTTAQKKVKDCTFYLPHDTRYLDLYPFKNEEPEHATGNMKCFVQFVTTPSVDTTGTTLLMHFDNRRYFFGNVSEGTQRACVEQGVGLMNLNDVFLTGKVNWQNEGGLLGLVLTIADSTGSATSQSAAIFQNKLRELRERIATLDKTNPKEARVIKNLEAQVERTKNKYQTNDGTIGRRSTISLYGGPNLTHLLATARRFIFRKGLPFYVTEYGNDYDAKIAENGEGPVPPSFKDENIKVWALPVLPTSPGNACGERTSRKRTRGEFEENANAPEAAPGSTTLSETDQSLLEKRQRDQIVRQATVSEMFNSNWQMDALVEVPLREAPTQAKLFIRNPETHKVEKYERPKEGEETPDITVLTRKPWPGANIEALPPTTPSAVSVSYIVQHHDVRGKFDTQKAIALGVERGAKFGLLTKGENVLSKDGKTITPDMVMGETQPGRAFAIAELPTRAYIDGFITRPEFTSNPDLVKALTAIIWILGPGVGDDSNLRQFMASLPNVKHIVSSPDYSPNSVSFKASAIALTRFSTLDADRYQPPIYSNTKTMQSSLTGTTTVSKAEGDFQIPKPGMLLHMQPRFSVDESELSPVFDTGDVRTNKKPRQITEQLQSKLFKERLDYIRNHNIGHDVEIYALGTGSSLPSKYRNVSATLVKVPGVGNYLLDCGEGTLGQMRRLFPTNELKQIIQDLKIIWVSHLHADHHLGTASVIKAWNEAVYGVDRPIEPPRHDVDTLLKNLKKEKRLFVISGLRMIDWLREYANVENYGFDKVIPLCAISFLERGRDIALFRYYHLNPDMSLLTSPSGEPVVTPLWFDDKTPQNGDKEMTLLLREATGLQYLDTVLVPHCQDARAVSFTFPSGFKLSYSGDCRPSNNFINVGRDSTVLIHEATFEDDMISDAIAKRHTTVSEALNVAKQMRARNLILTHFSQRYQCVPKLYGSQNAAQSQSCSPTPTATCAESKPYAQRGTHDVPLNNYGADTAEVDLPSPSQESGGYDPSMVPVVVAFDMMRLRLGDAAYAEAHLGALMRTYVATEGEDDVEAQNKIGEIMPEKRAKEQGKKNKKKKKQEIANR